MTSGARTIACGALLLVLCALPGQAVILARGQGTGNTSPPPDDPGWSNVVRVRGLSGVYLGDRWVLTAKHVGAGNVVIAGDLYPPVPGSEVQLDTGEARADLLLFRLDRDPGLPSVSLRRAPLAAGEDFVMIGHGRDRGEVASDCAPAQSGWRWASGRTMRWGTNQVEQSGLAVAMAGRLTYAFSCDFSEASDATEHEAHVAMGDSGGAVFTKAGSQWELAGILFARSSSDCQPRHSVFFGNRTFIADVSFYADQIHAIVSTPPGGPGASSGRSTAQKLETPEVVRCEAPVGEAVAEEPVLQAYETDPDCRTKAPQPREGDG